MRAGPLSSPEVVELLNHYFVPVYISNEEYTKDGSALREEKAERDRIFREALRGGLSTGTVHVYLLDSEGHPIASLHVAEATKADRLIRLLEQTVKDRKLAPGQVLLAPETQSSSPKMPEGGLVLHLVARLLDGRGAWGGVPAEDWVVLDRAETESLVPEGPLSAGQSWTVGADLSARILTHVYPATENNDVAKNRFESQSLRATILERTDWNIRARLDGELRMRHSFYHREDKNVVEANLVGYLDLDPQTRAVRCLRLVTQSATYGGGHFGVAISLDRPPGK